MLREYWLESGILMLLCDCEKVQMVVADRMLKNGLRHPYLLIHLYAIRVYMSPSLCASFGCD